MCLIKVDASFIINNSIDIWFGQLFIVITITIIFYRQNFEYKKGKMPALCINGVFLNCYSFLGAKMMHRLSLSGVKSKND